MSQSNSIVNIGILGAEGRMGRALLSEIENHAGAQLVAALTIDNSSALGEKYGPVVLTSDLRAALQICDVLIDFSHPQAAIDAALMMHDTPCNTLVTGTTGYSPTEDQALVASAENITLVKSGNFSIGICVLENLVTQATQTLCGRSGTKWDASILDIHHRHKVDAPSGTGLMLGRAVESGFEQAEITDQSVEYAAQRFGGVIGDHHVNLASELETITLSHRANDRSVFAAGALQSALWAVAQNKGLYTLKHVLGL